MPELLEAEIYRRAAEVVVGRTIATVDALDPLSLRGEAAELGTDGVADVLVGCTVTGTRRHGKLVLLDTSGPVLGLHFGMTGRLIVDDAAPIERLEYGSSRDDPAWNRTVVTFAPPEGGRLVVQDPRRLGSVELDPDLDRFGPDAASLTAAEVAVALGTSSSPLKARLLDQRRVAGLGNLLVDETLYRAGFDPARPCATLDTGDQARLAGAVVDTIAELGARGGSHTGDLQDQRRPDGRCPRDGAELARRTIGGRTTYSCPAHQR